MTLTHGIPSRTPRFTSKEDLRALEEFKKNFELEQVKEVTYGEYFRVDSKKYIHFTDEIPQYSAEEENLILTDNRILIQNISLLSLQQLNYRVWLFGNDKFYADDPENTKLIEFMDFNLPLYGERYKNTGLWGYAITDLNLLYSDMDRSNALHVAIENLSTTDKLANSGTLILQVVYKRLD